MVTPGTAYFGNNQVLLDTNVMVDKVEELNDLPIRIEPGNSVYLRDIGHAEDSYAIQTSRVRIDGQTRGVRADLPPAGRQQPGGGRTASRTTSSTWRTRCPPGTKLDFVMDQSVYVREAIHSLIHEGDRSAPSWCRS